MTIEFSQTEAAKKMREWIRKNPERKRALSKKWREKNPEKNRESLKRTRAKDPEYYKILQSLSGKLWYARKTHAPASRIQELEIQIALHKESKKNRKGLGPRRLFP